MSITTFEPRRTPGPIPANARDLVPHEADGVFLGWTYRLRSIFPWHTRWCFITPDGFEGGALCTSLTDAVNHLRGPHRLEALYDENA